MKITKEKVYDENGNEIDLEFLDLKKILDAVDQSEGDIRYAVDYYYQIQEFRKAASNQRFASKKEEPNILLLWILFKMGKMEDQLQRFLLAYCKNYPPAAWAMNITGIKEIIAAGLTAWIKPVKYASCVHRFAGLDPTSKWIGREGAKKIVSKLEERFEKVNKACILEAAKQANVNSETVAFFAKHYSKTKTGKPNFESLGKALSRCPWNARLKTLCWKVGDSFVKCHNKPWSFYGFWYNKWKAIYVQRNEEGAYKKTAEEALKMRLKKEQRKIYKQGKLPPIRIELMARRKAVKLFISHFWEKLYEHEIGKKPPLPYSVTHLKHEDFISADEVTAWEENMKARYEKETIKPKKKVKKAKKKAS